MSNTIVKSSGVKPLVATAGVIAANEFGTSFAIPLYGAERSLSGEILGTTLIATGTALIQATGNLLFFNADPELTIGDADLDAAAKWKTVIGWIPIAAGDWFEPSGGGLGAVAHVNTPLAFDSLQNIYAAWFHELATGIGADEVLDCLIEYRIEK
ncbi:MAG: hypothetical protein KAJ07_04550 [Planctomycetes bacterium]|nr:hypothetical protein [Planctomycetota bacterium]